MEGFDFRQVVFVRRVAEFVRENRLISGLRQARELNTYRALPPALLTLPNLLRLFVRSISTNDLPLLPGEPSSREDP